VATFAFGRRHVVLDTNVRRVLARVLAGQELPAPSVTRAERDRAAAVLPEDEPTAATWSIALMELGALVCTARSPRCDDCPVSARCAWRAAGFPAYDGPARRTQAWTGTDRQCRGRLLAVLRDSDGPVHRSRLDAVWPGDEQRLRCLAGLVADRLVVQVGPETYSLP
jgi:A/G-specific adenine glycosylase